MFFSIKKNRQTEQTQITNATIISPKHNITESNNIVLSNIYAKRCADELTRATVEVGIEQGEEIDIEQIKRLDKDYIRTGNMFAEVVIVDNKLKAIYHIPPQTIQKNSDGTFTQPQAKKKIIYKEFDKENMKTGNYILHKMNYEDDVFYGTPAWVGAKDKITQTTFADRYNSTFFENDCLPSDIMLFKNFNLDQEEELQLKDYLSQNFKGAGKAHQTFVLFSKNPDSQLEHKQLSPKIIDGSFIQLLASNKNDICAAFSVPPKLVGIETAGRLGDASDFEKQLKHYYENVITPRQIWWENIFMSLGLSIKLKRPPVINLSNEEVIKSDPLAMLREWILRQD